MERSILKSTKKILGLDDSYTAFDLDVLTHINTAIGILAQAGIGPQGGINIEDDVAEWGELEVSGGKLSLVRTYVFLRTRMFFDPPTTSYHLTAVKEQIEELEVRLKVMQEAEVL